MRPAVVGDVHAGLGADVRQVSPAQVAVEHADRLDQPEVSHLHGDVLFVGDQKKIAGAKLRGAFDQAMHALVRRDARQIDQFQVAAMIARLMTVRLRHGPSLVRIGRSEMVAQRNQ